MASAADSPVNVPPQFAQFMREYFGDKRAVLYPDANIIGQSIALDNTFAPIELDGLQGDFLYVDSDTDGQAYIKFNGTSFPWIPIKTNFAISGFPIKRAWLKNLTAQAGKVINMLFGYGAQIIPPNQDITSIGSVGSIIGQVDVVEQAYAAGSSYVTQTALAANTPGNVVAALSNVNGIRVQNAGRLAGGAGRSFGSLLSKATAPANVVDGVIWFEFTIVAGDYSPLQSGKFIVPANLRLDYIAQVAEGAALGFVNYDLL